MNLSLHICTNLTIICKFKLAVKQECYSLTDVTVLHGDLLPSRSSFRRTKNQRVIPRHRYSSARKKRGGVRDGRTKAHFPCSYCMITVAHCSLFPKRIKPFEKNMQLQAALFSFCTFVYKQVRC
jgi:hypothetical protein